jgi:hypothetical protein
MKFWKRFVKWLAESAGVIPRVSEDLVQQAKTVAREVEMTHARENGEYRRHLVYTRLVQGGSDKRAAALAIEMAIGEVKKG